jgi:hypothetical protein
MPSSKANIKVENGIAVGGDNNGNIISNSQSSKKYDTKFNIWKDKYGIWLAIAGIAATCIIAILQHYKLL